jgi:site-specific DNA-cytosine methylase
MRVLVACEFSGRVRDAFLARGHNAWSCDLIPSDTGGPHLQMDILELLEKDPDWDLMIAFPPCTHLAVSGARYFKDKQDQQREALEFVGELLNAPIPKIALENPVGIISTKIRKPDQIIQPYEFGHDASKRTCLWLKGLPLLTPTKLVEPRIVGNKRIWGNQTPSGQNKLGPSPDRAKIRSITYQGIAEAMAEQWGGTV